MVELPRSLADQLIAHARDAAPHEACGVGALEGVRIVALWPARNYSETPERNFTFTPPPGHKLGPDDGFWRLIRLEDGQDTVIYHSHPHSRAYPSATDRTEMSRAWTNALQLMVSLATDPPDVRAYRIDARGQVTEEPVTLLD
ncbi:MAG TPA: M67 family metallopeptidase [Chloroflexota bacterium]|nr:M67 family metallopeptidase [Chloroflexota bacterium]